MKKIETIKQLDALIGNTYVYAIIIAIAAIVLAFVIASLIKWGGGRNDASHIKRRVWFIIVAILAPIGFFLYNALYVSNYITKAPLQAKFSTASILAASVVLAVYVVLGIITMFIMRRSKWGSILGKSKK
jgi:Na+/H+-dicarboxylate symporter